MPSHIAIISQLSRARKWRALGDRLILSFFAKIRQNRQTATRRRLRPLDRQETLEVSTGTQMSCSARCDARNTTVAPQFTRIYIMLTALNV